MSSEPPKIEWPKERHVGREGDMGPERLWVTLDSDNDVIVSVGFLHSVEFCNGGGGGGRSPHTRAALINVMTAIERDAAGPEARADSAVPSSHVSGTDERTRSQKLADAGFTRRPSWRSLPKDGDEDQSSESILREALALALDLSKCAAAPFFRTPERRHEDGETYWIQPTTEEWWAGLRELIEAVQPKLEAARSALAGIPK